MVDVQKLSRKGIDNIYVQVSSAENLQILINSLTKIKFFLNLNRWLVKNKYENSNGSIKYLILNLKSREVAFNRNDPNEKLFRTKLFVNENDDFINAGPKKKILF
jgi:hypothetical protein